MDKIHQKKNFISKIEVEKIVKYLKETDGWSKGGDDYWDGRCLYIEAIEADGRSDIYKLLFEIKNRIALEIQSFYVKEAFPDLINFVRWPEGIEQPPHCDDMSDSGPERSWFNHREWGAIIYLNNDFVGGKTYYPNFGFEADLEPGMLVIHPGNQEYLHGITKVFHGTRYTIASFWTTDPSYERKMN